MYSMWIVNVNEHINKNNVAWKYSRLLFCILESFYIHPLHTILLYTVVYHSTELYTITSLYLQRYAIVYWNHFTYVHCILYFYTQLSTIVWSCIPLLPCICEDMLFYMLVYIYNLVYDDSLLPSMMWLYARPLYYAIQCSVACYGVVYHYFIVFVKICYCIF